MRRGEAFEIKVLVSHVMETGYRRTETGIAIPRDILRLLVCSLDGEEIVRTEIRPAIAANPFFAFWARADRAGTATLTCACTGDGGYTAAASASVEVD